MPKLSQAATDAYRDIATTNIGTFGEELSTVLREQCATPEFAGQSVADFLASLPRYTSEKPVAPTIDAFYAEHMLSESRRVLLELVAEDEHMADILRTADPHPDIRDSLDPEDITRRDLDRYIRHTTSGDQRAVDDAIQREGRASDREISDSFQSGFTQRGEGMMDFSRLPPDVCFMQATRALIDGVLQSCLRGKGAEPRMQPLVDGEVMTHQNIASLIHTVRNLASKLRYDNGGFTNVLED